MARTNNATPPAAARAKPPRGAAGGGGGGDDTLEALKLWWHENGVYLVVSAVIGLAAVGGWRVWEHNHQMTMREAAGVYAELLDQVEDAAPAAEPFDADADDEDAAAPPRASTQSESYEAAGRLFADLRDGFVNTPYPVMAALALARLHVEAGDLAAAAERLRWAADNADQEEFKALALVRLMRVLLEMGKIGEAADVLIDNDFPRGFDPVIDDVNGDVLNAQRRPGQAIAAYREALSKLSDQQGFIEMKLQTLGAPASDESGLGRTPPAPVAAPADTGVPSIMR